MYLYLQAQDPKTREPADCYHRRGALGPGDDAEGFARMMAKHRLSVVLSEADLGPAVNGQVLTGMGLKPIEPQPRRKEG